MDQSESQSAPEGSALGAGIGGMNPLERASHDARVRFPSGDVLDLLLSAGQFVFVEPNGEELVCADYTQLSEVLARWVGRPGAYFVRWKRADGSLAIRQGPLPPGWGIER